ncbi:MAG: response regulator transcription factor, partial [Prevotella sp.]|nr:response regulator transcription factor [Prevotella sp.]
MYKILVVDDEEDLCEILRFNLETEGYLVDTVHSAEEALSLALEDYDLILLDVMMGKISGFSMAQMLKKSEQTKNVPFIFLTARDTENDTITGFNLGADDYIAKPFSIREVMLRVKAVLKRTQKQAIEKEDKGETLFFEG